MQNERRIKVKGRGLDEETITLRSVYHILDDTKTLSLFNKYCSLEIVFRCHAIV